MQSEPFNDSLSQFPSPSPAAIPLMASCPSCENRGKAFSTPLPLGAVFCFYPEFPFVGVAGAFPPLFLAELLNFPLSSQIAS